MPRNARLRLAQNVGEVRDGELGLAQERQDAQARAFSGRLEGAVQGLEIQVGRDGHNVGRVPAPPADAHSAPAHKDIFIRLSGRLQGVEWVDPDWGLAGSSRQATLSPGHGKREARRPWTRTRSVS